MPSRVKLVMKWWAAVLLAAFLPFSPSYGQSNPIRLRTVVLDAGHGGHDPGAISKNSKLKEKDINLDLVQRVGALIEKECPDVKVVYTRKTDKFVELAERGNIANRNHADLFISIHVNSAKSTAAAGTETFVMGTDKSSSNMEVCKRENSVILMEDDYTTTYEGFDPNNPESYIIFNLMQNAHFEQSIAFAALVQQQFIENGPIKKSRGVRQAPLMVLWRTTMPSALIEVGFLSNASDRTVLNQVANRQKIAQDIFNAFKAFKQQYDAGSDFQIDASVLAADEPDEPEEAPAVAPAAPAGPHWEIQILASGKKLKNGSPELKGVTDYHCRFINGFYKYSVGNFSTKEAAAAELPTIRKKFPGAFVISAE
ncbi:MAG: N-acetylmuramoyl-L-alanine amidase [Bacteroidales bacterium]|nr:N-acetylmuramoyl-L-alanine amidase [Bacteroidales bacterium]